MISVYLITVVKDIMFEFSKAIVFFCVFAFQFSVTVSTCHEWFSVIPQPPLLKSQYTFTISFTLHIISFSMREQAAQQGKENYGVGKTHSHFPFIPAWISSHFNTS